MIQHLESRVSFIPAPAKVETRNVEKQLASCQAFLRRWWIRVLIVINQNWLVVELPLWKIWVRQLGWWTSQLIWNNKACSSHYQPVIRLITTWSSSQRKAQTSVGSSTLCPSSCMVPCIHQWWLKKRSAPRGVHEYVLQIIGNQPYWNLLVWSWFTLW